VRRLLELDRIRPEDFDENADLEIREQLAKLEKEELNHPSNSKFSGESAIAEHEYNE
jgi:hypothetical protein